MSEAIRELFDLPEQIRKGDFVHKLSEGVEHARETAQTYVVTAPIADAFDRALGLVGSALRDGASQAAYVHGSFGSGKSHFMALLSLLLDGNEEAWRVPELHALRAKHAFVGKKRALQLRLHMIDKLGLEDAIFGGYVEHVRTHHPDANVPGLFADATLFADARQLLDRIGDEAFFAPMGAKGGGGWGTYGAKVWDRARFERVVASSDLHEREQLFGELVRHWFSSYASSSHAWVPVDEGLATLTRHAKGLGYDAVVLFLDELILWLAGRAADASWLHREAQKMVKLVEAQDAHREVPVISFIARQRDLSEMVGDQYVGDETARLRESLKWWEGRYDVIKLEDKNLPAIIEKRILRPASPEAKKKLEAAFQSMRAGAGSSYATLVGRDDAESFRKVYPFSPALVEALVALSNSLQRQRTAIKLLMELLVHHTDGLELGEVVRVGDLFDVLAAGDDPADGVMRSRFQSAKTLYQHTFLPLIRQKNQTATPEKCQRARDDHPSWKGCSGCAQRMCRTDNRLIKTLLVAALVPQVEPLRDMTASRLVQLNHGSLKLPIPGTEASLVAGRLKEWASAVGQLHVGEGNDPAVSVRLEGVDLSPILEQARSADSPGARMKMVRDLLFDAMGVPATVDWGREHKVTWRETTRRGFIRFANVRKLGAEELRCPDGDDWRLIVDYPFDDAGFGPHDDERVLEEYVDATSGSWTLVWIPSFFSKSINDLLGELVVLEHILDTADSRRRYLADLSPEQQARALTDLENLRNQKRSRIRAVLEQAYGLRSEQKGDLEPGMVVEQHLRVLKRGAQVTTNLAPNLAEALERYVPALLESRWPRHPQFTRKLATRATVEQLVHLFGELVDSAEKKLPADRKQLEDAQGTLGVLGLVRTTETSMHLVEDRLLQDLEKRRAQQTLDRPSVAQMRGFLDPSGLMGLEPQAEDLVVRCYARWAARTFVHFGRPYTAKAGDAVPGDVELEKPDLPSHAAWAAAIGAAGTMFGVAMAARALHADNLKKFEHAIGEAIERRAAPAAALPGHLRRWLDVAGIDPDCDRLTTSQSAATFVAALKNERGRQLVDVIASYTPRTSAGAVGRSLGSAEAAISMLANELAMDLFRDVRARGPSLLGGAELIEDLAASLRQDELNSSLVEQMPALIQRARQLLKPETPDAPPAPSRVTVSLREQGTAANRDEALRWLRGQIDALESKIPDEGVAISVDIRITKQ